MTLPIALVVEDDPDFAAALEGLVKLEGFDGRSARSLDAARKQLQEQRVDVVLVDLELPDGRGTELVGDEDAANAEFIVVTGHATVDSAVNALRGGALDYLTKPVDRSRLRAALANVLRTRSLKAEVSALRGDLRRLGRFGLMVGASDAMQTVYDLIARVAPTQATALIMGESGTGKELAAQTIHRLSRRHNDPWVAVNCGAISAGLIESELFGHEKGSFTGADRRRTGVFEEASGGTLFLDEITEMPADLQVKLLRTLEESEVTRVGGRAPIAVDVRVIAATNRDPELAVREGRLREDCSTACTSFRSRFRRSASATTTSSCSRSIFWPSRTAKPAPRRNGRARPSNGCARTAGPATCASCATRCSARSFSPTATSAPRC